MLTSKVNTEKRERERWDWEGQRHRLWIQSNFRLRSNGHGGGNESGELAGGDRQHCERGAEQPQEERDEADVRRGCAWHPIQQLALLVRRIMAAAPSSMKMRPESRRKICRRWR
uniref:Uncharacterized protein n=1 Tax=Oryza sativa subsp. japonica TaxID=39947 RepID=Q69X56_ORYSJ|nr:hypothetical protein [Oryza sativa Japonica Group]